MVELARLGDGFQCPPDSMCRRDAGGSRPNSSRIARSQRFAPCRQWGRTYPLCGAHPSRLGTYAQERGWANLRLLSARSNTFNRDFHGGTPEGEQLPVLNVFSRDEDGIHHRWASELTFTRGDNSPLDAIWPIWGVLDLTPEGAAKQRITPHWTTSSSSGLVASSWMRRPQRVASVHFAVTSSRTPCRRPCRS